MDHMGVGAVEAYGFQMVCLPNGVVFQIPHLGLRQSQALSEGQRMIENTSVFKHFGGTFLPCES